MPSGSWRRRPAAEAADDDPPAATAVAVPGAAVGVVVVEVVDGAPVPAAAGAVTGLTTQCKMDPSVMLYVATVSSFFSTRPA